MPAPLSGPGLGLPLAQRLYPSILTNAPIDVPANQLNLAPGDELPIPAGTWYVSTGSYNQLEYLDPITSTWIIVPNAAWLGGPLYVKSDGFNYRIANRLGCLASVSVTAPGDGNYVQSTTSVTVTGSTASVTPIVGGQVALSGGTLRSNGAGYGVAPIVLIGAPADANNNSNGVGGVQAAGYCTIQNGTVSGFTFTNPGAGYQTAPVGVIVPNPTDPNLSTGITAASIVFSLTASGSITGAVVTNPGAPITPANITLTVSGAGASATLTPNMLQTTTAASVIGSYTTGYGTVSAFLTTVGGYPNAGTFSNDPNGLYLAFRPRPAQIELTVSGVGSLAAQTGTIYDGGLFLSTPVPVVATRPLANTAGSLTSTGGTLSLTMGSRNDIVTLQPAP